MFGIFRFVLAQMVAVSHLWPKLGFWLGPYAVFSFYLLSGYLMSLVLDRTYAESPRGIGRFLANRALRIHPPYWCLLAATLALVTLAPEVAKGLNPVLALPQSAQAWASNLFIFGVHDQPQRLIPPAWSLHVELVFYCAMALGLARRRWLALAWFAASLAWTLHANIEGQHFLLRYLPVQAASLPFSLGACLYHFRGRLAVPAAHLWVAAPLFVVNAVLAPQLWERLRVEGFSASL
ncbi:MAG: acyltransferase family protein, partial [Myxococcota bacterium]